MTNTLTAQDVRRVLSALRKIDEYHSIPATLRPPEMDMEYWRAKGAADEIRETLMRVCLQDVAVEVE
jgi:hypothetical protein